MAKEEKNKYRVALKSHRLSYLHVKTPSAYEDGDPKYSATVLVPKDHEDADKLLNLLQDCYDENKTTHFKGVAMTHKNFRYPLQDGDDYADRQAELGKDGEAYRGCYYIKAATVNQPPVFDENGEDMIDLNEIKSGDYGRVSITIWPYSKKGTGITAFLNSVKKIEDGEPLGSAGGTAAEFEDEDDQPARRPSAPAARPAAPAAAKPAPRPAPVAKPVEEPVAQWAKDADGNDIYSWDGVNWEYAE